MRCPLLQPCTNQTNRRCSGPPHLIPVAPSTRLTGSSRLASALRRWQFPEHAAAIPHETWRLHCATVKRATANPDGMCSLPSDPDDNFSLEGCNALRLLCRDEAVISSLRWGRRWWRREEAPCLGRRQSGHDALRLLCRDKAVTSLRWGRRWWRRVVAVAVVVVVVVVVGDVVVEVVAVVVVGRNAMSWSSSEQL